MAQDTPSEQLQKRQEVIQRDKKKSKTFLIVCTAVLVLAIVCNGVLIMSGFINPVLGMRIIQSSFLVVAIVMSVVYFHFILR